MGKYIVSGILVLLLLAACSTAAEEQPVVGSGEGTLVTVYRAPT
jgi:outer membrane biogenesis lipoprotein LolB